MFDSKMSWDSQSLLYHKARYHSEEKAMVSGEWLSGYLLSSSDSLWWKGKNTTESNLDSFKSTIKQNEQFKVSNSTDIKTKIKNRVHLSMN